MDRRKLLGGIAALALSALMSVGTAAATDKHAKLACSCCGAGCACPACICDGVGKGDATKIGKDCACCGGSSCCGSASAAGAALMQQSEADLARAGPQSHRGVAKPVRWKLCMLERAAVSRPASLRSRG